MSTGFEIANDIAELKALVDKGDFTPEQIADTIEAIESDLAQKLDSYMYVVGELESKAERCKKEADRQSERKSMFDREIKELKIRIKQCLDVAGLKGLKTDHNTFTIRKGFVKVVIDDDKLIPDEFVDVATIVAPKKAEIKKALEDGADIPGAHLETGEPSLTVR